MTIPDNKPTMADVAELARTGDEAALLKLLTANDCHLLAQLTKTGGLRGTFPAEDTCAPVPVQFTDLAEFDRSTFDHAAYMRHFTGDK